MNFLETAHFKKAYQSLPWNIQIQVKETLRKLAADLRYPSLQVKKIKGTKNIWEARVTISYRLTFQIVKDFLILRNVGPHDSTLKNP